MPKFAVEGVGCAASAYPDDPDHENEKRKDRMWLTP